MGGSNDGESGQKERMNMTKMAKYPLVLLVVIFIVISKSPGQCAWVLWNLSTLTYEDKFTHDIKPLEKGGWEIVEAFPKYEQCVKRQEQEFLKRKAVIKKAKDSSIWKEDKNDWLILGSYMQFDMKMFFMDQWKCLPDTIDPRKK